MKSLTPSFFLSTLLSLTNACMDPSEVPDIDFDGLIKFNNARRSLAMAPPPKTALTNISIFDGHRLIPNSTIVIDGGILSHNTDGATFINGQGGVLLPGFIESHAHPMNLTNLETFAANGVTTVMTMACYSELMCSSLKNHTGLPSVFAPGVPATAPNSTHALLALMAANQTDTITTPADAAPFVAAQLALGADYIKLVVERPGGASLDQATLSALVSAAHDAGKITVTHAVTHAGQLMALAAGSDMIHHAPLDTPLLASDAAQFLTQGLVSVPTLSIEAAFANAKIYPGDNYAAASASVTALHAAGVPILVGTDANEIGGKALPVVPFGTSFHAELGMLVQAGLTPLQALRAATVEAAEWFGLGDRGVIRVGARADLVLVKGNPLEDISATSNIQRVWIGGVEFAGGS